MAGDINAAAGRVPEPQELAAAPYVSLATFRRSGVPVATPIWCAAVDDAFYFVSAGDAGKVKRLRVGNRARLALCDVRGRLQSGWREATAELITDSAEISRAAAALRKKYGWQMWLLDALARLSGRYGRRAWIRAYVITEPDVPMSG